MVLLESVLIFATGAAVIPPVIGFSIRPTIMFDHGKTYPTASTCDLCLHLPVLTTYDTFANNLMDGLQGHGKGFGQE